MKDLAVKMGVLCFISKNSFGKTIEEVLGKPKNPVFPVEDILLYVGIVAICVGIWRPSSRKVTISNLPWAILGYVLLLSVSNVFFFLKRKNLTRGKRAPYFFVKF